MRFVVVGTGFGEQHCHAIDSAGGEIVGLVYHGEHARASSVAERFDIPFCSNDLRGRP